MCGVLRMLHAEILKGESKMRRKMALFLVVVSLFSCLTFSGCGKKQSAKEKYGMDYVTRSDGTRVWYYTK
jgi:ABC-type oligopeptide transport system substrate-binding subunit